MKVSGGRRRNLFIRLLYRPQMTSYRNKISHNCDLVKGNPSENDGCTSACTCKVTDTKKWRHIIFCENVMIRSRSAWNVTVFFPDHFRINIICVGLLEEEIWIFEDLIYFHGAKKRFSQLWRHRLLRDHATTSLKICRQEICIWYPNLTLCCDLYRNFKTINEASKLASSEI